LRLGRFLDRHPLLGHPTPVHGGPDRGRLGGSLWFIVLQLELLTVEHRGLAGGPLMFNEDGTDFRRRGGVTERSGDQPQLRAVIALLHGDERA
jgi:hypothetical protein